MPAINDRVGRDSISAHAVLANIWIADHPKVEFRSTLRRSGEIYRRPGYVLSKARFRQIDPALVKHLFDHERLYRYSTAEARADRSRRLDVCPVALAFKADLPIDQHPHRVR
jgi:hypothetical protein